MSKTLRMVILIFVALDIALLLLIVLRRNQSTGEQASIQGTTLTATEEIDEEEKARETVKVNTEVSFRDNDLLYNYDLYEIQYLYVTVVEGSESEGTNHTLAEVDSYINAPGMERTTQYLANAIVKAGDEKGPVEGMLGIGKTSANATINVRGKSSTSYAQKSYKLELFKNEGLWNGQRTIALNKHPVDMTRFRNALYFKLMREVPSLISLRTHFVHLYLCDNTASGDGTGAYKDYGLFTAVEQPNNRFLRSHGLNTGGYLYKAVEFEFFRYPEQLKLITDPTYDDAAFQQVLEPKADTSDHSKLLNMLDDVNDYTVPIEEIVEKHFDIDNILDFMAFNILLINPDSSAQNFYIYSPLNVDKWYFICWDGDAILREFEDIYMQNEYKEGEWEEGISMYSNNILLRRIMISEKYRNMLTERIEQYKNKFTEEKLKQEIAPLQSAVLPIMMKTPDLIHLNGTKEQILTVAEHMPEDVTTGYLQYQESLKMPLPFYLGDVEVHGNKLLFTWDEAYDFAGELVKYQLEVVNDIGFTPESIQFKEELFALEKEINMLKPGNYYFKVTAVNESGYTRTSFDQVSREEGIYSGIRGFIVNKDGTVVMMDAEGE